MPYRDSLKLILACTLFLFGSATIFGQGSGYILRQPTNAAAKAILDPNNDRYASKLSSGFSNDDVANSEIPFKAIPAYSTEPFGDLRRGPSHQYSDFVPDANGSGVYLYFDASGNLIVRMRMGSIIPGSKGYSVLIDTDGKFGATGANADPNYLDATTGVNGNPGFEIEVDLFTQNSSNPGVSVYNVDGTSSPGAPVSQTNDWLTVSQTSIAGTSDNGDPDFFLDFYVPFTALQSAYPGLTTSTPLRFNATTVMAPLPAIGGPKSDIYGVNDAAFRSTNSQYETVINSQPSSSLSQWSGSTTSTPISTAPCTAPPVVNSPIGTGTVSVMGSWTKSNLVTASSTATITVYKNGSTVLGTVTNVSSGSSWSLPGVTVSSGDLITAMAEGTGESVCQTSNTVTASSCNSANRPATPVLSCTSTTKGITGTNLSSGWTVHVDNMTYGTQYNNVTNTTAATFGTTTTGSSPTITWTFSGGCSTGSPMTEGSYKVYYTDNSNGGCASEPTYVCSPGNGGSKLATNTASIPSITAPTGPVLTTATTTISGSAEAGSSVYLYVNGSPFSPVTATGTIGSGTGTYSFTNLKLSSGQQVYVMNEVNTGTSSTSKCAAKTGPFTVLCFTTAPMITTDNNGQLTATQPITGTSGEPAGTTIKVYTAANALVATTTVQADGSWSTGSYTAIAGTSYYATATNGSCGVSAKSATVSTPSATTAASRCGTINGGITCTATTISGTITGSAGSPIAANTKVNVYEDGILIGTFTFATSSTNAAAPWSVSLASGTLYANATISIGIQEAGTAGEIICSSTQLVSCTPPTVPNYSQLSSNGTSGSGATISKGGTMTYTISNLQPSTFYTVSDPVSGQSYADGIWTSSSAPLSVSITTYSFTTAGTYNGVVKATTVSSTEICTIAAASSNFQVLQSRLASFNGVHYTGKNVLSWKITTQNGTHHFEIERSIDGQQFSKIAYVLLSSGQNTYSVVDEDRVVAKNWYRLKLVDQNGKSQYSNTIMLSAADPESLLSAVQPNPFKSSFNVQLNLKERCLVQLSLYDNYGRLVKRRQESGNPGTNIILVYDLDHLPEGVYFLKISAGTVNFQKQLIKLR